jgi:hypothetical protein
VTIDDRDKDVNRIREWVADKPFHQIMDRRIGSDVAMIQTREGEITSYSYIPISRRHSLHCTAFMAEARVTILGKAGIIVLNNIVQLPFENRGFGIG